MALHSDIIRHSERWPGSRRAKPQANDTIRPGVNRSPPADPRRERNASPLPGSARLDRPEAGRSREDSALPGKAAQRDEKFEVFQFLLAIALEFVATR